MDLNKLTIDDLRTETGKKQKFVIVPHKNPDGDAIGSALGLMHYLQQKGKQVHVVVNDRVPPFLNYLPGFADIVVFENEPEKAIRLLQEAECIICNDYSQLHRCGAPAEYISASAALRITIDHHPEPEEVFDYYFHEVPASSTSELVYLWIQAMEPGFVPNSTLAQCLYTGLLTDTGCFKHALRPLTFEVAAGLLATGISYEFIVSRIFDTNTPERLKTLGFVLNEKLVVLKDLRTAFISLSYKDTLAYGIQKDDTEGLVNYTLSVENMVFGAFFHEREPGKTKISFRSKGNFAVNRIMGEHFTGGGHKNAAGGLWEAGVQETIDRFLAILPQYAAELHSLEIGKRS